MKLSILDYVPIFEGRNANQAINHAVELAQLAEKLNYSRYWVAEHHQVFSVASSAPEMIMMSLLENTNSIEIGSGGVMLPHYSAYKVAEVFKTMEARHPGRVNLGTGHSKSYQNVNKALNEHKTIPVDYENQIDDLIAYFNSDSDNNTKQRYKDLYAMPIIDSKPDMFILGTSKKSASLAAIRGLPFVIANMGQDEDLIKSVITHYRSKFKALHPLHQPYVIMTSFVITADNKYQRQDLANAFHLWLLRIGYLDQPKFYPSVNYAKQKSFSSREIEKMNQHNSRVIVASPSKVISKLKVMMTDFDVDEIMIQPHVYGEHNRKQIIQLLATENFKHK
ncbi:MULTISPECIES: LLM class flavin-dependent oxidoreductase [Staphylococcus]|uniref:LLM class flavin-dependent oxidoreductase n=1 Tax=Staphylococcus TaxID=1279 RepID=UPI000499D9B3|nr:LLM class flavin-dependent oxidoreductase [Staphylococcus xylosus]AID02050.1 alkane 1-monooxygenase [Staphylococcus xylosus]KTW22419.1 alkane 1-monooxygenase [Staphylococcus xylosus]MBF0811634.1 LLM class flavin-dependent oxidoreductase [Staphylococcus xylosus]MCD8784336.1 LLM class flavin-dependent oxidoreductase [Staphylococcus xylosus]MCD8852165.1 LLM class flavin-dependent oxidoreductase [Staphylococcus xylosus]